MKIAVNNFLLVIFSDDEKHIIEEVTSNIQKSYNILQHRFVVKVNNYSVLSMYRKEVLSIGNQVIIYNGIIPNPELCKKFSIDALKYYDFQAAIAFIDENSDRILVVRDSFGTRAVFYTCLIPRNLFIISSDLELIRKMLEMLGIELHTDIIALYEFMINGYISRNRTLFKEIKKLEAGQYLELLINNKVQFTTAYYWNPEFEIKSDNNSYRVSELIDALFDNLYIKNIPKDENVGLYFSGGLDTTLITSALLSIPIYSSKIFNLISVYFREDPRDLNYISRALHDLKKIMDYDKLKRVLIHEVSLNKYLSIYLNLLRKHLRNLGLPSQGDAALPYLLVAHIANRYNPRYMVTGDGGDGLFGGYDMDVAFLLDSLMSLRITEAIKVFRNIKRSKKIVIGQLVHYMLDLFPSLKYYYIRRKLIKIASKNLAQKKKIVNLISHYISRTHLVNLSNGYTLFKRMLFKYLKYKLPLLALTNTKAHEYFGIALMFPFLTRKIVRAVLQLNDRVFFLPLGSRSIQRIILKIIGFSPEIYMQSKVGFSTTDYVLRSSLLNVMKHKIMRSPIATKYFNLCDVSNKLELLNLYNAIMLIEDEEH
ncbi:MAG: hypothetical protein DRP01_02320 [Archaeoglobales archaeon]|nr:MAG: hypothetical protein DRP01_02320 [Archaeoglobales archaeon]